MIRNYESMAKLPVYNIEFHGYKLDKDVEKLPTYSGIYMIYRCIYNAATDRVTLKELFYIGKATNLHDEVNYHKYRKEFLKQAQPGEEICYAYAEVSKVQYDVVENALIFMQKPRLNEVLRDNYKHQDAEFHFSGECDKLGCKNFQIADEVIIPLQQQK